MLLRKIVFLYLSKIDFQYYQEQLWRPNDLIRTGIFGFLQMTGTAALLNIVNCALILAFGPPARSDGGL